jgi:hypothetical protein
MARDKPGYKGDLTKLDTRSGARSVPAEDIEAARVRARGAPAAPYDPALHARLGREMVDRSMRAVMGNYPNKGRQPLHILTSSQFSQFTQTGEWEGMPTPEEYGPQDYAPEDKEYT